MSHLDFSEVVNWPHSLRKLPSLIELQLSSCGLPDVNLRSLSFINSSTSLQVLDLSENALNSSIFYWMANVSSNFVHIGLSLNNLQGLIPDVFFNMVSLVSLDLSGNHQLEGGLPKSFQNFGRLESLSLEHNQFSENIVGFVKTLFCAQNTLQSLYLSNNRFGGSWPDLTGFSKLRLLDLSYNQLDESVPESVGQLSSLEVLDLSNNSLSGVITEAHFLNLSRLRSLFVSGNRFSINLSSNWNPPFQLDRLGLPSCKVGPDFPKWIQRQRNLTRLDLCMNQIQGNVPNLSTSLTRVDLFFNQFSGALPSFSPKLYGLILSNNMFSGSLSYLCAMRLYGNNFSGELPSFENCTQLIVVDLGANKLSGKIPTWIGPSVTDLQILRLQSNEFNGIIPFSMCNLAAIHVLDLSQNNISGALPHCFNNITTISCDLAYEYLFVDVVWKGTQTEFGMKNVALLTSIDISSNNLVGEIPESITSMIKLHSLNLSRNKLTGKVPENFGNLKKLESLDLSRNQISGRIPASFSSLNFLGVLDVSHNHLYGRISLSTQLQSFNVSAYVGNSGLCGPPLTQNCPGDGTTQDDGINESDNNEQDNDGLISMGFIISTILGFVTGFWIMCGSLLLKSSWRYAYFKFLDDSKDWVYVKTVVYKAKMQRRLQI